MSGRLAGKAAIVTGGASGFGAAIARRFAAEGARVLVADRDAVGAGEVARQIREAGGQAQAQAVDVAEGASVEAMVQAARAAFGGLDIYVNNAGIAQDLQDAGSVPEAEFDRLFAVNTKGLYWCAAKAVPALRERGGVILSTASAVALRPRPRMAWYCASKAALITASKALALELAPHRIRVCCLAPTAADTPMLSSMTATADDANAARAAFAASIPLGRLGEPRDMADAALFLASDEASFLTGVCLEVDGGRSI